MALLSDAGQAWAGSGAADLTGRAGGPGLIAPDSVTERILALGKRAGVDALALLTQRAAYSGLTRRGTTSCGGGTRLLAAADGWVAVTLARPDDVASVPAWLELPGYSERTQDPWGVVEQEVRSRRAAYLVERGRLLAMPVAALGELAADPAPGPATVTDLGGAAALGHRPLVVDLSSLWAGPLCTRILADAGAHVVKVESTSRPDGARRGEPGFFRWLNGGKEEVSIDLGTAEGVHQLRALLHQAQVVVEGSRPRALRQWGIDAEQLLKDKLGPSIWVSITGHGRRSDRVAFGDDAAVAGRLVAYDADGPCFVADAVADPLAGIAAAGIVRTALVAGGRWLIDVPLAQVAAHVAAGETDRWTEAG
jgi:hypothetical protein